MVDVAGAFKLGAFKPVSQRDRTESTLKTTTALRKSAGWLPGLSLAGAIKIALTKSGISLLRSVLGRRRVDNAGHGGRYA